MSIDRWGIILVACSIVRQKTSLLRIAVLKANKMLIHIHSKECIQSWFSLKKKQKWDECHECFFPLSSSILIGTCWHFILFLFQAVFAFWLFEYFSCPTASSSEQRKTSKSSGLRVPDPTRTWHLNTARIHWVSCGQMYEQIADVRVLLMSWTVFGSLFLLSVYFFHLK